MAAHYVYVLQSQSTGRRYIGVTADVERRLLEHNRGKSPSVRGRGPFEMIWREAHETRAAAMRRERQLKRYKGGEALERLLASASLAASPSSNG